MCIDNKLLFVFRRAQGRERKIQGSLRRHGCNFRRDDRILNSTNSTNEFDLIFAVITTLFSFICYRLT